LKNLGADIRKSAQTYGSPLEIELTATFFSYTDANKYITAEQTLLY